VERLAEARLEPAAQVGPRPGGDAVPLRVGAAEHPRRQGRLLGLAQPRGPAGLGPVVQPGEPLGVVAHHGVAQGLALHAGEPGGLGPAHPLQGRWRSPACATRPAGSARAARAGAAPRASARPGSAAPRPSSPPWSAVVRADQESTPPALGKSVHPPAGITPVIPTKKDQPHLPDFDREAYRERNRIERLINHLKQFRRMATRYEKRGINYFAMLTIGMIMLWL
jgi:transposase